MNFDKEDLENFQKDIYEYMDVLDVAILDLEKDIYSKESIDKLFRTVHTLKSMFGMAECDNLFKYLHDLEDFLEKIRSDEIKLNSKIVDYLLVVHDFLLKSVEIIMKEKTDENIKIDVINEKLTTFYSKKEKQLEEKQEKELILTDYEILQIEEKINKNEMIYFLEVDFDLESEYNITRIFVLLKMLEENVQILKSNYIIEDLNLEKNIKIEKIRVVFKYKENIEFLNLKLKGTGDIKRYLCKKIDETEILDMKIKRQYDLGEESGIFLEEFLLDIEKECDEISQKVIELNFDENKAEAYFQIYRNVHTIKGLSGISNQINIRKIVTKMEEILNSLKDKIEIKGENFIDIVLKVVFFIKKICRNYELNFKRTFLNELDNFYEELENKLENKENKKEKKIGEILKASNNLDDEDIIDLLMIQKEKYPTLKLGEIALKENKISYEEMQRALEEQSTLKKRTHIKVSTEIIDALSEITSGIMSEMWGLKQKIENDKHLQIIERLTIELGDIAREMRKINFETLFHRLKRVARDAEAKLNKNIDFEFIGKEISVDREYEEALYAPMTHIVKNSISHGIEDNEKERINKGKNKVGKIKIEIQNLEGFLEIKISDDGKGIDLEKILEKGLEKGILQENKKYSKKELLNLIFLPGFSTMAHANGVSGRGVGMDVVKKDLEKIGAGIDIKTMHNEGTEINIKIIT